MAVRHNAGARRALRPMGLAMLVAVLLLGAVVAYWGWRGGTPTAAFPDAPRTPPAATSAPAITSVPAERERPTAAPPRRTPRATASPTAITSEPAPPTGSAVVSDEPVQVRITRGAEILVDAPIALTQLNERDELNPPSGVVGWYGPPQWATVPGELSAYPGVLAGHTTHSGARDVFYRLGEVRAGDLITIRYADGAEAVFQASMDALSVPKNDVTEKADAEYSWVWRLPEPGRTISLFSCDPAQGLDLTGHSVNNWVVQATLIG